MPIIAIIVIAVALLGLLVYHALTSSVSYGTTTTTSQQSLYEINSCTAITAPGTYYLTGDISTSIYNGSCIAIRANNVRLLGEGHSILGNGPFVTTAPYTYGISIVSHSNVSVTDISLSRFSYGMLLSGTSHDTVSNITIDNSTLTGFLINSSSRNLFYGDQVSSSGGQGGGINIALGTNNTFEKTTSDYNSYYGITFSNSTGNAVYNSTMVGSPVDFYCNAGSAPRASNRFYNTTCYVNDQCNFAYCSQINNQSAISAIRLGSTISSCGTIVNSGSYSINRDLNLADYLNISDRQGIDSPCISINASSVSLNCNGHSISNAPLGISSAGQYNVTVSDCRIYNGTYGVYMNGVVRFRINSVTAQNNGYGIYITNSTNGNLTSDITSSNNYGILLNNTVYTTVTGLNASENTYGVLTDNATSIYFKGGSVMPSYKTDFYCTASTYNSTNITLSGTACRSTDCNWATSCPVKSLPNLVSYPVGACRPIVSPGSYTITGNLLTQGTCFDIEASNVTIDCAGHGITGQGAASTAAFEVSGQNNIDIHSCRIAGFDYGINIAGSLGITLNSSLISAVNAGVLLSRSSNASVSNVSVRNYAGYGFSLNQTNDSRMLNNSARSSGSGYGFLLNRAFNNLLVNNSENASVYGFYIAGSRDNMIYNNSALANSGADFYCDQYSSGVYAQKGRMNTGVTKSGCRWLVATSPTILTKQQQCTLITSPDLVSFTSDMYYPYASTCFNIRSNSTLSASGTTINCNGHTVFASGGGAFVNSTNSSVTVEDCVLVGFNNPITITSSGRMISGVQVLNNTIAGATGNAIYISNVQSSSVIGNNVINASSAIYLYRFNSSSIRNNAVLNSGQGISLVSSGYSQLINNTVSGSSHGQGMALAQSPGSTLSQNRVTSLVCSGSQAGDSDNGANACISTTGCGSWLNLAECK
jgi:parallel beta-helix repeat protein